MEDIAIDHETPENSGKIPTFLKVLCILTFVSSGLGILGAISSFTIMTPEVMYDILVTNAVEIQASVPPFDEFREWSIYNNIVSTITSLLGLAGGIMMWKLKKQGYYIYVASWVISLIITILSNPHLSDSVTAQFFPIVIVLNVLIMAAFLIMYGVNLKHMKA